MGVHICMRGEVQHTCLLACLHVNDGVVPHEGKWICIYWGQNIGKSGIEHQCVHCGQKGKQNTESLKFEVQKKRK